MHRVPRYLAFGLLAMLVTVVLLHMRPEGARGSAWLLLQADAGPELTGQAVDRACLPGSQQPTVHGGGGGAGTVTSCKCPCTASPGNRSRSEPRAGGVDDRSPKSGPIEPTAALVDRRSESERRPSGPSVILLTSMRTGSSFVGEIFGQNPDVFYLFEPGLALLTHIQSRGGVFLQPQYVDMLKALYRCDAGQLEYYLTWLGRQSPAEVVKKVPRVSERVCRDDAAAEAGKRRCRKPSRQDFETACRQSASRVIKSIRVSDIGMLDSLLDDVDLKVVHLVRDPRGMTASRVQAMNAVKGTHHALDERSFTDEMRAYLLQYCAYSVDDQVAGYYLPKYRDNYLVLRYEDMALAPLATARRLYRFAGLGPLPDRVAEWLTKNTQTRRPGIYSTSRLSSREYQYWRTRLSLETTKAIEEMGRCGEMMTSFGYLPVRDEGHLKNLSASLLDTLPGPSNPGIYALT